MHPFQSLILFPELVDPPLYTIFLRHGLVVAYLEHHTISSTSFCVAGLGRDGRQYLPCCSPAPTRRQNAEAEQVNGEPHATQRPRGVFAAERVDAQGSSRQRSAHRPNRELSVLPLASTNPAPHVPFLSNSRSVNVRTNARFLAQTRARTYSWEDIIAAADAAASTFDYNSSGYAGRPDTIDEADEGEPYVIYSTSPRPPLQSAHSFPSPSPSPYTYTPHTPGGTVIYSTSPSHSPSPSPTLSPPPARNSVRELPQISNGSPYYGRRLSWCGPHSRHSSLSSISEEDEGLARL